MRVQRWRILNFNSVSGVSGSAIEAGGPIVKKWLTVNGT